MSKNISYSQFSMWSKCPYRWKLNYIDKYKTFTDSIHTIFGTSMHEVFQTYLNVMYSKTVKDADSLDLNGLLKARLTKNYEEARESNNDGVDFCTRDDMIEFYYDGVTILDWVKKHRGSYFSKRGYELIGIEVPLDYDLPNGIKFRGYIDVVIKDTIRNVIKIYDIKTSTMGWNKYVQKDKSKTDQLLLYKQFYSKQFDYPIKDIEVEFFILKRKLYENVDFPQKRVQKLNPSSGTPSINKVTLRLKEFMDESFTKDGEYNLNHIYRKEPSTKNCKWCEFKDKPDLCDRKRI